MYIECSRISKGFSPITCDCSSNQAVSTLINKMADIDHFIAEIFGPPPPGIDIHESSQVRNYIIISISLAIAAIAVLLRWLARTISSADLLADDYVLILVAFVRPYLHTLQAWCYKREKDLLT